MSNLSQCFSKYSIIFHCKVGENLIGSYRYISHATHTIIFTNSRKSASGFTPGVFQSINFFRALLWHHYTEKKL